VAQAGWDDAALLRGVREQVLPAIERHGGPVRYWMVDDTAFPKQGKHSVGVARQYCGQLGKQENCQVAVSLSVANDRASLPIAWRLYLPEVWAEDPARRARAGVPEEVGFETKTAIALGQLRQAREADIPVGTVLGDAGYGDESDFRVGVAESVYANKSLTAAGFVPRAGVRGWRSWRSRCAQQRGRARGHRRC
jgi:SRSO17 transposase